MEQTPEPQMFYVCQRRLDSEPKSQGHTTVIGDHVAKVKPETSVGETQMLAENLEYMTSPSLRINVYLCHIFLPRFLIETQSYF